MKKTQSPWYLRVKKEQEKLDKKINKLADFLENDFNKDGVDPLQWDLMEAQLSAMLAYSNILGLRIRAEDMWEPVEESIVISKDLENDRNKK